MSNPDAMLLPPFVRPVDQYMRRNTARVSLQKFMCFQNTGETINEELKDRPMEDIDRPSFIRMVIKRVQRFIQSMSPHHNLLDIYYRAVERRNNIYISVVEFVQRLMESEEELETDESSCFMFPTPDSCIESPHHNLLDIYYRAVERRNNIYISVVEYIRRLMASEEELETDESSCFMVPTTDSFIESLERKVISGGCQNCAICLEEFPAAGCEVVSMPCSHIFHGDCIQIWLKTSHYCPVCRSEMPTE